MQINLLPKQTKAWDYFEDALTEELGYGGAAGGGKTRLGCFLALYIAKQYPGSRGGIGRKELKNLKRTTLASFFEVCAEQAYVPLIDFNYNQQDSIIKFPNGSEIILFDTAYQPSDPLYTRFGSYELTWCWVDESNESPWEAIQILKTRVGRKNVFESGELKPFFLETFNPNKGHVYKRFYKPYRDKCLPDYRKFVVALPGDNPFLPRSYIENLKRADKITRERLLYGNFEYDDDETKLMRYDSIIDIFSNVLNEENKKRYITIDVARLGKDKTTIYVWEGYKVIARFEIPKDTLDNQLKFIEKIRSDYGVPKSNVIADEDGVGGGIVDFGGYKGFVANSSPILDDDRQNDTKDQQKLGANYRNLKTQCYFLLSEKVNNAELAITCELSGEVKERIIEDLDSVKRDKVDSDTTLCILSKDKQKEILGRSPDDGDAIMMRMYFGLTKQIDYSKLLYV